MKAYTEINYVKHKMEVITPESPFHPAHCGHIWGMYYRRISLYYIMLKDNSPWVSCVSPIFWAKAPTALILDYLCKDICIANTLGDKDSVSLWGRGWICSLIRQPLEQRLNRFASTSPYKTGYFLSSDSSDETQITMYVAFTSVLSHGTWGQGKPTWTWSSCSMLFCE